MRHLTRLFAGLAIAAAGLTTVAVPASASWSQCVAGRFCGWQNANGDLLLVTREANPGTLGQHDLGIHDVLTSYWNRGSVDVLLGDWDAGRRCYARIFTATPGAQGNLPASVNDRADIMKIGYGSGTGWC